MKEYIAFIYWHDCGRKDEKEYVYPIYAFNILQAKKIAQYFCDMNNFLCGNIIDRRKFGKITADCIY